jgi:hybrid cluster-associated redox disulfide protein
MKKQSKPSKKTAKVVKAAKVTKVTKDSNLAEVVYKHPEAAEVLIDYGLHCVECIASAYDTVEAGAKVHGLSDKEIDEMIERVNEVIKFKE